MRDNPPDRFHIRKSDRTAYNELKLKGSPFEDRSPLKDQKNRVLFMMALITGFKEDNRVELDTREGFILDKYLTRRDFVVINAIAISVEGDLDVLADTKKVYSIAEEYAAGGILFLKSEILDDSHGSYTKRLEAKILEKFGQIEKNFI